MRVTKRLMAALLACLMLLSLLPVPLVMRRHF